MVRSKLRLISNIFRSVDLQNSTFLDKVFLIGGNAQWLSIDRCKFEGEVENTLCTIKDSLTIKASHFNSLFEINLAKDQDQSTDLGKMYVTSSKFDESLTINGFGQNIDKVRLKLSSKVDGSIIFTTCHIHRLELEGYNYSDIDFTECTFNSISITYFFNIAGLTLISNKGKRLNERKAHGGTLEIKYSDLGDAKLFNFDFEFFGKITIIDSVLLNLKVANVTWFADNMLNSRVKAFDDFQLLRQNREIYRQLKQALIKQGDKIGSVKFKELEKKYLRKEKLHGIPWWKKCFNVDRLILILNQSNNYGLNFIKPIGILIMVVMVFYILMLPGISAGITHHPNFTLDAYERYTKEFFYFSELIPQFFNPVHSLGRILPSGAEEKLGFFIFLMDTVLKLIVAYLIFQTVTAFRKYL
ncbi:MAG: hypothetical protein GVX78_01270 [Bacteroidetes bacterium]|nr:hypothetical protein [Bacteroidota bacterium]